MVPFHSLLLGFGFTMVDPGFVLQQSAKGSSQPQCCIGTKDQWPSLSL